MHGTLYGIRPDMSDAREKSAATRRVIEFLAQQCGYRPDELDESMDLYGDLKVWGDDVDELFIEFSEEFGLALDEVDVCGCFPGEVNLFNPFPRLFFRPKRRIRIKHLVDAVLQKTWPELERA